MAGQRRRPGGTCIRAWLPLRTGEQPQAGRRCTRAQPPACPACRDGSNASLPPAAWQAHVHSSLFWQSRQQRFQERFSL